MKKGETEKTKREKNRSKRKNTVQNGKKWLFTAEKSLLSFLLNYFNSILNDKPFLWLLLNATKVIDALIFLRVNVTTGERLGSYEVACGGQTHLGEARVVGKGTNNLAWNQRPIVHIY